MRFGIEPTFICADDLSTNRRIIKSTDRLLQNSNFLKDVAFFSPHPYNDEGLIELPSKVFNSKEHLLTNYRKLLKVLEKWNVVSSGIMYKDWGCGEGGCHINIDSNIDFPEYFDINYPSVIWSLLAPYDNVSAEIGIKATWIDVSTYGRIACRHELRFFEMITSVEELSFFLTIVESIVKNKNRLNNKNIKFICMPKDFETAIHELFKFCEITGIDYSKFKKFGRIESLKKRYEKGLKYLI